MIYNSNIRVFSVDSDLAKIWRLGTFNTDCWHCEFGPAYMFKYQYRVGFWLWDRRLRSFANWDTTANTSVGTGMLLAMRYVCA